MGRGHSRAVRGALGGMRTGVSSRRAAHRTAGGVGRPAPAPAPVEDLTPQEEVRRAQAAVHDQTRALILDALDGFERGDGHPAFNGPISAFAFVGHRAPDRLMRAAMLSVTAGDKERARGYLVEALGALHAHMASFGQEPDDPWLLSANISAQRAAYDWMLQRVDGYITDDSSLEVAAARVEIGARHFDEEKRLAEAMTERMAAAARAHRDEVAHALAIEVARASGDEALLAAVERFDKEQVVTLGRVARAISYSERIIGRSIDAQVLADIAGDGLIWRAARLEALYGREAEREFLLVHGEHRDPATRGRDQTGYEIKRPTPVEFLERLLYHARTSVEAGAPARIGKRVGRPESLTEMIEHLETLPGRVRYRAVRSDHPWRASESLRYQVTYEGTVAGSDQPVEISLWHDIAESRQAKADAQLKRLHAKIPAGFPAVEDGYWEATEDGLAPVIAGPNLPPAPSRSLDELLGPERTCAHPKVTWERESGPMASARCDTCKKEVLRRPTLRLAAYAPAGKDAVERERDVTLPHLQALACLMGEEPPASIEQILAMPRCDDWRAELRRELAAADAGSVDRSRPRSIAEAMRRR